MNRRTRKAIAKRKRKNNHPSEWEGESEPQSTASTPAVESLTNTSRRNFALASLGGTALLASGAWMFWPRTPPEWKFLYLQDDYPERYDVRAPSASSVKQFVDNLKRLHTLHSERTLRGSEHEYREVIKGGWNSLEKEMERKGVRKGNIVPKVTNSNYVLPELREHTEHVRAYAERACEFLYDRYPDFHPFEIPWIGINGKQEGSAHNKAYLGRYVWRVTELSGFNIDEPEKIARTYRVSQQLGASVTLYKKHSRTNPGFSIFLPVRDVVSFTVFSETIPLNSVFSEQRYQRELLRQGTHPVEADRSIHHAAEGFQEGLANYILEHFGEKLGIPEPARWAKSHRDDVEGEDLYKRFPSSLEFIARVGDKEAVKIALDDMGEFVRRVDA
ncbi:hypothetical protein CMO91_01805 [Candidatus Woesearchaeota archaeon]|nr:hypothetical protein [Candidatus Woesearchaeota archaeon]